MRDDIQEIIYTFMQVAVRGFIEADRDASIIKLEVMGLIEAEDGEGGPVKTYILTQAGAEFSNEILALGTLHRNAYQA